MEKKITLRQLRKRLDKTQAEVADLLNISTNTVSNYEKGITPIPGHALLLLCLLAGVEPSNIELNP